MHSWYLRSIVWTNSQQKLNITNIDISNRVLCMYCILKSGYFVTGRWVKQEFCLMLNNKKANGQLLTFVQICLHQQNSTHQSMDSKGWWHHSLPRVRYDHCLPLRYVFSIIPGLFSSRASIYALIEGSQITRAPFQYPIRPLIVLFHKDSKPRICFFV